MSRWQLPVDAPRREGALLRSSDSDLRRRAGGRDREVGTRLVGRLPERIVRKGRHL